MMKVIISARDRLQQKRQVLLSERITRGCVFILFLLSVPVSIIAQNFEEDYQRIDEAYSKSISPLSFDVHIIYYPHHDSKIPSDSMNGKMILHGEEFYYKIGDYEYLKNATYYLLIDHTSKLVMVSKSADGYAPVFDLHLVDSLVSGKNVKVEGLPAQSSVHAYQFTFAEGNVTSMKLSFDPKTFLISQVILLYKQMPYMNEVHEPMVIINYNNFRVQPNEAAINIFSEKKYITEQNNVFTAGTNIKGYKIHKTFSP